MPPRALHSPSLSKAELRRYFRKPLPTRHPHSLIEVAQHDFGLIRYLAGPLDPALVSELVRTTRDLINVPEEEVLPTPPLTPLKSLTRQQHLQARSSQPAVRAQLAASLPMMHPEWRPLEQFIPKLINNCKVGVPTLCYTLLVLERLKTKLPPQSQGMMCTRHRIFFAALVIACKYLNDSTPKNKHWAVYCRGLFEVCEITLMEKQLLSIIGFDLRFTERQLVDRLFSLLPFRPAILSTKKPQTLAVPSQPITPLTPITPPNAIKNAKAPESKDKVTRAPLRIKAEVVPGDFVLQPVPAFKKRIEKPQVVSNTESSSMTLSVSHSAPSHLVNGHPLATSSAVALPEIRIAGPKAAVPMPLTRSFSSDGLLEGAGSMAMSIARTFSSTVSSSMTASSSISASTSTSNSEVSTPPDPSTAYDHMIKPHLTHRRGSDSSIRPSTSGHSFASEHGGGSRIMSKLLGVGKNFSPARRVGHGIKSDRKVSTATIVPDEVHIEH